MTDARPMCRHDRGNRPGDHAGTATRAASSIQHSQQPILAARLQRVVAAGPVRCFLDTSTTSVQLFPADWRLCQRARMFADQTRTDVRGAILGSRPGGRARTAAHLTNGIQRSQAPPLSTRIRAPRPVKPLNRAQPPSAGTTRSWDLKQADRAEGAIRTVVRAEREQAKQWQRKTIPGRSHARQRYAVESGRCSLTVVRCVRTPTRSCAEQPRPQR
jgi:hypothetical protein